MNPVRLQKRAARIMGRSERNTTAGNELVKEGTALNNNGIIGGGEQLLKRGARQKERADKILAKSEMKKGGATKKYMTGGMVNSNAKVSALKSAGSKGVKSGVNAKAKASTTAKGRTGGTSKAPKGATPTKNKRG